MKKFLIFFCSLIVLACSQHEPTGTVAVPEYDLPSYSLHIQAVEFKKSDSINTLLLESTLWNNTRDTLNYLSMSCSWEAVYSFSNPNVTIPVSSCTKNVPVIISVIPETNAKTFFKVNLAGIGQGSKAKVKLGIKLVQVKNKKDVSGSIESLWDVKNTKDIVWSNEIEL